LFVIAWVTCGLKGHHTHSLIFVLTLQASIGRPHLNPGLRITANAVLLTLG